MLVLCMKGTEHVLFPVTNHVANFGIYPKAKSVHFDFDSCLKNMVGDFKLKLSNP